MSRKPQEHPQKNTKKPVQKQKSYTRLWVRIVAIGCAVLMLGSAIPLGIWLAIASL